MAKGQILWKETFISWGIKAGMLALVGGLLTWFVSGRAHRDANGDIAKAGTLSARNISPGDCFQNPAEGTSFSAVTAVPCGQAHSAQAYGGFTYPTEPIDLAATNGSDTAARPSADAISAKADPVCAQQRSSAVDEGKVPAAAQFGIVYPDSASWMAGNVYILCIVSNSTAWNGSVLKPSS